MSDLQLFSPGPTPLSQETTLELSAAPVHHRSDAFKSTVSETLTLLEPLFDEKYKLIFCSTGTGGLEASVTNLLTQQSRALSLDGGKFGERWAEIFKAYGVKHQVYKFPWGSTPNAKALSESLKSFQPHVVFMQACETSTATQYEISSVSNLIKKLLPDALLVVDGITAVGAYPLSMKKLGIDVLITGSQKALGLPTGLSILGLSERALDASKKSDLPKYYFDFYKEVQNLEKNCTHFSSPTQLWRALNCELKKLQNGGLEQKYQLNLKLQNLVLNWAKESGLELFSESPSPSLTAIKTPQNMRASDIQNAMIKKGFFLATGQAEFKEKIFRIGHMANINLEDMKNFLKNLSSTLKELRSSKS